VDGGVNRAVLRMVFLEVGVPSSSLLYGDAIGEERVFRIIYLRGHHIFEKPSGQYLGLYVMSN
jgi:hypothetical protein